MRHQGRKQTILIAALAVVAFVATTHFAHAQQWFSISNLFGLSPLQLVNQVLAMIVNAALQLMGWLLAISGFLLNLSIKLTLNIRAFVDSAPAIYTTWRAIRDISGLFLIFFLIYASIQLILGLKSPKWGDTIKNIVLVGVLINFSFFLAGLGIDISNVVSVQIYNAIAPANDLAVNANMLSSQTALASSLGDGGISNIFMNALQLPRLYNVSTTQTTSALGSSGSTAGLFSDTMKIMLIGVLGIIIEFVAAVSFAAAAFAFVGRFVFLLFLLAFSPVMFMDMLAPEIAEYTNQWKKTYKSMLLFMPVYLLLMYMAMNVLTTTPLFQIPGSPVSATATTNPPQTSMIDTALAQTPPAGGAAKPWYMDYIMLGVNAVIILFFINMPLAAAASVASKGNKFLEKSMTGFKNKMNSQLGSRTLGRAAYALNNSKAVARLASASPIAGSVVTGGLSKVSKATFGEKKGDYESRLKEKGKREEALHKQIGTLDESLYDSKVKDAEGKTELDRAKDERKAMQARYRENLPWKNAFTGKPGGVIGFMVDNRANRQTSAKLEKEAEKKEKEEKTKELVKHEREIRKNREDAVERLDALKKQVADAAKTVGFAPGRPATQAEKDQMAAIEKEIEGFDKQLDEIADAKDAARADKIANTVAEKTKKDEGEGEKPKEKSEGEKKES